MLINNISSPSHNVPSRPLPQGREKSGLCGKGLKKEMYILTQPSILYSIEYFSYFIIKIVDFA